MSGRKPDDLSSAFIFVPAGAPEPTAWMAAHPGWIRIPAVFVPRPAPGAEGGPETSGPAAPAVPGPWARPLAPNAPEGFRWTWNELLGIPRAEAQPVEPYEEPFEEEQRAAEEEAARERVQSYNRAHEALSKLEPTNPALTILTRPGWLPSEDDLTWLEGALAAAEGRRARRLQVDGPQPGAFPDQDAMDRFADTLARAIEAAGYPKPRIGLVGSSVTGTRFLTGKPFDQSSDLDVYIVSSELFNRARAQGFKLLGAGTRTPAIRKEDDLLSLGLPPSLIEDLKELANGRKVSVMIYRDQEALLSRNMLHTVLKGSER